MFSEKYAVRFCETDALTHVGNTVVPQWFETAREPIFRMFTPDLDLQNWPLILASYKIDFLKQLFYGSDVEIRTYVSRIGGSSFDTYQEVWQNGEKCSAGTTTMVNFDYQSKKAVRIPDDIRAQLQAHLKEEEA